MINNNYSFFLSFFLESLTINQTKPTRKCKTIIPATTYIKVFELSLITFFFTNLLPLVELKSIKSYTSLFLWNEHDLKLVANNNENMRITYDR